MFLGVQVTGFVLGNIRHRKLQLIGIFGIPSIWGGVSYLFFVTSGLIVPTAVPICAILLIGNIYIVTDISRN